jgi:hypothetical protein
METKENTAHQETKGMTFNIFVCAKLLQASEVYEIASEFKEAKAT